AGVRVSVLVSPSVLVWLAVTVSGALVAVASVLEALAVSLKVPASRSACVIACVPVQTTDAPGARAAAGIAGAQLNDVSEGLSETVTLCSVVLPVLVAVSV